MELLRFRAGGGRGKVLPCISHTGIFCAKGIELFVSKFDLYNGTGFDHVEVGHVFHSDLSTSRSEYLKPS